jgi:GDP-4-dehydro-6-deoxy-D-mannose reductase
MSGDRALITGIHGFSGRHLARHLSQHGYTVYGVDLVSDTSLSGVKVFRGDIRNPGFVRQVVRETRPSYVFHLAALIAPSASLDALYDVNVRGTEVLLEALQETGLDSTILITGSSAVYGPVEQANLPIHETQPFRPLNSYAVSKIVQEMVAYTYHARYNMRVVRTRAFNLVGPGQSPSLACSAFARQIAHIEGGQSEPVVCVGNLTPRRDFVDVRDGVCAYRLVAEQGFPGQVYNVCSGQAISIRTCLDELLNLAQVPVEVTQDPDRMRASDVPVSVGDGSLLQIQTGWHAAIPLKRSLVDLLDDWRQRVQKEN